MSRLAALFTVLVAASALADLLPPPSPERPAKKKEKKERHDAVGAITLNGEATAVRWTDGDSFSIQSGPHARKGTRLTGYNTLEAYGPVHQWGAWTPQELYVLAKASSKVAAAKPWVCTTDGKEDGYHRLLVHCPELAVHMAREGHGLAYAVDGEAAAPEVLAAQAEAMKAGRGMWAKGATLGVVTSLHSLNEDGPGDTEAYNRVVDTRTGQALKRAHRDTYETCQRVCLATDGQQSCMVYVPFKKRYRDQPECLKMLK